MRGAMIVGLHQRADLPDRVLQTPQYYNASEINVRPIATWVPRPRPQRRFRMAQLTATHLLLPTIALVKICLRITATNEARC